MTSSRISTGKGKSQKKMTQRKKKRTRGQVDVRSTEAIRAEELDDDEFEKLAFDDFEAIMAEEVDVPVIPPLNTIEPTTDHQLVITCSAAGSSPSASPPSPQPEVPKNKRNKLNLNSQISARITRSKVVNLVRNTRSKKRI
jgi:hypothetical protein